MQNNKSLVNNFLSTYLTWHICVCWLINLRINSLSFKLCQSWFQMSLTIYCLSWSGCIKCESLDNNLSGRLNLVTLFLILFIFKYKIKKHSIAVICWSNAIFCKHTQQIKIARSHEHHILQYMKIKGELLRRLKQTKQF